MFEKIQQEENKSENSSKKKESKMSKSKGVVAAMVATSVLGGASVEAGEADMFKELDREMNNRTNNTEKTPVNPTLHKEKSSNADMFSDMDELENLQKTYAIANESKRNDIRKEIARVLIEGGNTEQFLKKKETINLKSGDFRIVAQLVGGMVVGVIKDVQGGTSDFRFSLK